MNLGFGQSAAQRALKKAERIRLLAYQLWVLRQNKPTAGDAENDYHQAERIYRSQRRLNIWLLASFGFWVFVIGAGLYTAVSTGSGGVPKLHAMAPDSLILYVSRLNRAKASPSSPSPTPSATASSAPSTESPPPFPVFRTYEWKREDAIKFGLDQLTAQIKSLLLAAGGVFWFALKFLLEHRRSDASKPAEFEVLDIAFNWNALLACAVSLVFGFLGGLYLSDLATRERFSPEPYMSYFIILQMFTFFAGAILIVSGVYIASRKYFTGSKNSL
jgi:hypothetical protein